MAMFQNVMIRCHIIYKYKLPMFCLSFDWNRKTKLSSKTGQMANVPHCSYPVVCKKTFFIFTLAMFNQKVNSEYQELPLCCTTPIILTLAYGQ